LHQKIVHTAKLKKILSSY